MDDDRIKQRKEAMEDEGVADWTLQREVLKYNFKKQQRIMRKDVGFLMRVKSKLPGDFVTKEAQVLYVKSKLKDLAHNY